VLVVCVISAIAATDDRTNIAPNTAWLLGFSEDARNASTASGPDNGKVALRILRWPVPDDAIKT